MARSQTGSSGHYLNNADPDNEYMYQMPTKGSVPMQRRKGLNVKELEEMMRAMGSEGEQRDDDGRLDLTALNLRLQDAVKERAKDLGLQNPSTESLKRLQYQQQLGSGFQTNPFTPSIDHNETPSSNELVPGDSVSMMYRPSRAPQSIRRGGTNVDPQEGEETQYEDYDETGGGESYRSWGSNGGLTMDSPRSGADTAERMTLGNTSVWTGGAVAGNMYAMKDRLENAAIAADQNHAAALNNQLAETAKLSSTLTKLELAEQQLRTLQATLIAERVARTQIERDADSREEERRNYKHELASAVRALRRARDEGKRTEEEKKRVARCFEEARDRLYKYHEEIKVRDARARGREEGRQEAWQEAERWMGGSPPIPVNPIQSLPSAVLQQTPFAQYQPMQMATMSPMVLQQQMYQQPEQPLPQAAQQSTFFSPQQPMQPTQPSVQQQPVQQSFQHPIQTQQQAPPQSQPLQQQQQSIPIFVPPPSNQSQQQPPQMGRSHSPHLPPLPIMQMQGSLMGHSPGAQSIQPQYLTTAQPHQIPQTPQLQSTPHQSGPLQMPQIYQQQYVPPPPPPQQPSQQYQQSQATPVAALPPNQGPYAVLQPIMVPVAAGTGAAPVGTVPPPQMAQGSYNQQTRPPTQAPSQTQTRAPTRAPTQASGRAPTQPPSRDPTQPPTGGNTRGPTRAPTQASHSRGYQLDNVPQSAHNTPPRRVSPPMASQTQGVSSVHPPRPATVSRPHDADSYLERVDRDPRVKELLRGAPPQTLPSTTGLRSDLNVDQRPGTGARTHNPSQSNFDDSAWRDEKPLPDPNSTRGPSRIQDGDRYPAFPLPGPRFQQHSRQSSGQSFDPANIALPPSQAPSAQHTPMSSRYGSLQRDLQAKTRSRLAAGLRANEELSPGELSNIDETEERGPQQMPPPPPPPQQPSQSRGPRRELSMPSMRNRPVPVMPVPLGGGRAATEYGAPPRGANSLYSRDQAANLTDRLPEAESTYRTPKSHPLFVPPEMASQAAGGSVEDFQAPRTSALGLSGINGGNGNGRGSHYPKAPTSSNNRSGIPSPRSNVHTPAPPTQTNRPNPPSSSIITGHPTPKTTFTQGPPPPGVKRQTFVVTERFSPDPYQIPLPGSKSHAPTAYTGGSVASPSESNKSVPGVSIIDYAMAKPLPPSRPVTVFVPTPPQIYATTVHTEVDAEEPGRFGRSRKPSSSATNLTSILRRKPVPDPNQIPLPPSRAPSRRPRTSTYAGTVHTIDEITEEESGIEGKKRPSRAQTQVAT
ncbi:hypothetical protein P7C73_g3503, partial [Tremellales sp. Uapishka_1]